MYAGLDDDDSYCAFPGPGREAIEAHLPIVVSASGALETLHRSRA